MNEAVYEMLWDCKYCGQKKLLGITHRFCAGCGAPQDPNARYFPPDNEKVAVKDHPYVGADVTCPSCRQPMSRAAKCCTNCGGPIAQGAEVAMKQDVVIPPPGYPPPGHTPMGMAAAPPPAPSSKTKIILGVVGAIAALVLAVILVALFWKREGVFEVHAWVWERSIAVERFEPVRKTVWCDDKPIGARELSRHREQKGTDKVKDGETCGTRKKDLGNGSYKEVRECQPKYKDVPVYADRCDIELTEWHVIRTAEAKGASPSDPPRWPNAELGRPGTCLGCEREGARNESYTVVFTDLKSKGESNCDFPQDKWASFAKGSKWKGKVRVLTGGLDCDALVKQ
jgi:hypothetical protein